MEVKKEKNEMKNTVARMANFAILSVLLPFVYGCQGGGGGGAAGGGGGSLSSLVGGGGVGGGSIGDGFTGGGSFVTGENLATIHNPEPATMLLLGSGFAAMAFYKAKRKK